MGVEAYRVTLNSYSWLKYPSSWLGALHCSIRCERLAVEARDMGPGECAKTGPGSKSSEGSGTLQNLVEEALQAWCRGRFWEVQLLYPEA